MTEKTKPKLGKLPYNTPQLIYVGQIQEIIQGGGGKLSRVGGDPGEPRKPKGHG